MEISLVIQQVAILAIFMAISFFATKIKLIDDNTSKSMTQVLTGIALPALIINSFNMKYSKETIKFVVLILFISLGAHTINIVLSKLFYSKYKKDKSTILEFGTVFSNVGFMGLPLILELFGQEAVIYASVFMIPYHTLLWTYGDGRLSGEKSKSPIKKLIKTPALVAIFFGIIVFIIQIDIPYLINQPISMLSAMTSPLSMIILGEKIAKIKFKEIIFDKNIYYGSFIRLIISPTITLLVLRLINTPNILLKVVVTMQALPAAVMLVVLTDKYKGDTNFASKFTVVSHLLSIITIPLIFILINFIGG